MQADRQTYLFEETVGKYIEQLDLIRPGDTVLAAVSGGADSVCLLLVLQALSKRVPFTLRAFHAEHGIRGEESREDAHFTQALCSSLSVPLGICSLDVPSFAAARGIGTEEAARILRYEAYAAEAKRTGAGRVALAHHRGDTAETVLFHLCRGTGLQGLTGIVPVRDLEGTHARIVRPLLCTDREEICAYVLARGGTWREDSTNQDVRFSRNRIRHCILPQMRLINEAAEGHIAETAQELMQVRAYLEREAARAGRPGTAYEPDGICMDAACFQAMDTVLQKIWVRQLLAEAAGSVRDLTREHVDAVCGLFAGQVGRRIRLPYGLQACREYSCVRIGKEADGRVSARKKQMEGEDCAAAAAAGSFRVRPQDPAYGGRYVFEVPKLCREYEQTIKLPDGHCVWIKLEHFDGNMEEIPRKTCTKWFDYDKIKDTLQVRTRQPGDFLQIGADGGHRKLKDWMIDAKIPAAKRDTYFLLAADAHVLWVFEGRTSEAFRVEKQTETILTVHYE